LHQQGLDTTTPAGKAMFQMLGVFAEFELRGPILAISAVYAFAVIVVQTWEIYFGFARSLSPIAAGTLMCLGLLALGAFGRMEPDLFGQSWLSQRAMYYRAFKESMPVWPPR
jgi:hypothetical protein